MATKAKSKKDENQTDAVNDYMAKLEHPLKEAMESVREIIKSNPKINERVKWNAPSFFYMEDLVTFNPRAQKHVHLVFHNIAITHISSPHLEGDYKDRRMMYFTGIDDVKNKRELLADIITELVEFMDIKYN
ncbi:MAG: DUF1801 domain-containing protein [Bacteroidia bacterium]